MIPLGSDTTQSLLWDAAGQCYVVYGRMGAGGVCTAALTGSDEVFDAFFRQKGIIRVEDIEEFVGLARLVEGTTGLPRGFPGRRDRRGWGRVGHGSDRPALRAGRV